eukprot:m.55912 g.55912  ORF g.55912 m.55912 type:complete len:213 (-) comp13357_c0_seq4:42-680(-)
MGKEDKEATKEVLDYMLQTNRPYSALDVATNLHDKFSKTVVAKVLTELAEAGKLKEKLYNKQKIYFPNQEQFEKVDRGKIYEMEQEVSALKTEVAALQSECQRLEAEAQGKQNGPTLASARMQLSAVLEENKSLSERLEAMKADKTVIPLEERKRVLKAYDHAVKEWRSRKRMATDIVDSIMEGYPKKRAQLLEDMGVETDESASVNINEFL